MEIENPAVAQSVKTTCEPSEEKVKAAKDAKSAKK